MDILSSLLKNKGCSIEIIKFASVKKSLLHESHCKGDINKFIDLITRLFWANNNNTYPIKIGSFDDQEILRKVEREYNGDILDYHGYTFCNNNTRW